MSAERTSKMHILFFFSILHKLYGAVAEQLRAQDPGMEFSGILYGLDQLRYLRRKRFPSARLYVFTAELRVQLPRAGTVVDFLARWEQQHRVSLSTILSADRRYSAFPREEGLQIAAIAIRWCEGLLDRLRPDVIVAEGIDDLLSYVLYCAARQRGILYLITYSSPTPGRVAIYSNPDNHWEKVEEVFQDLRRGRLTESQRQRAEALVADYREKQLVPSYMKASYTRSFSGLELSVLWTVAWRHWVDPAQQLDPSYAGSVAGVIGQKVKRLLRAGLSALSCFEQPRSSERFVFYPLQMEPECSTLVFAPFHANQIYLIECLAKSLPIDHRLYVKEHPVMVGRRPLSDYQRIRSLPNVRLISPRVSSYALIRDASAVVVVTSTVGWEALLCEKPVIAMGNVWFDACPLAWKVETIAELPTVLRRAILGYQPDRELLLKFVAASLEGTYPGRIEHPDYSPEVLSPRNVAAIATAVRQHLEWLRWAPSRSSVGRPEAGEDASARNARLAVARSGSANLS